MIPLKFVPIVLEFELGDTNDAVIAPFDYALASTWNAVLTLANTTNAWQIQNECVPVDHFNSNLTSNLKKS